MPRQTDQQDRVLGLFAKQPVPGQVKTRLAAETCADWAAQVADAFLRDTLHRLLWIDAHRVVAFAPADAEPFFANLIDYRFQLIPQVDGDLGQRMAAFFAGQFQAGAKRVVLIGTDTPTLPPDYIERAFDELKRSEVEAPTKDVHLVLGPATDGGYYLIGLAGQVPPIFEGISWGSERVLAETTSRLPEDGCRLTLLPPWYDVDTLKDWRVLTGHVYAQRQAGFDPGVGFTEGLWVDFDWE